LTRMLTFAMEVSNIEGSFRITCENVMRVIRQNKESLLAVLEAFIHDPLLNWRLNTRESPPRPHFRSERRQSIIDAPGGQGAEYDRSPMDGANNPAAMINANAAAHSHVGAPPGRRHRRSSILDPAMGGGNILDATKGSESNPAAQEAKEVQNARALQVLARVKEKLTGRDFKAAAARTDAAGLGADLHGLGLEALMNGNGGSMNHATGIVPAMAGKSVSIAGAAPETTMAGIGGLGVADQVDRLILQATNVENLCQHYIGWCSFW